MSKRSIARRRPVSVFRVDGDPETRLLTIKMWLSEDEDMRRADHYVGRAFDDEYAGPYVGRWLNSRDTDGLHELPPDVLEFLFEFDSDMRSELNKK